MIVPCWAFALAAGVAGFALGWFGHNLYFMLMSLPGDE